MAKKPVFVVLAVVVVLVAVLLVAVLTIDFDSPELGRALLARAGGGLELSADEFRLNLLRGLRLAGATVSGEMPGGRLDASVDVLVLRHRPASILTGTLAVEEIVFERPVVELTAPSAAAPSPAPASTPPPSSETADAAEGETEDGGGGLAFAISRFAIDDGSLTIRDAAGAATEIRGLDVEIVDIAADPTAPSALTGLSAQGELSADEVVSGTTRMSDVHGRLSLAGGLLTIEELVLPTPQGRLVASTLEVDFNADPYTWKLAAVGDPLDTNVLLAAGEGGKMGPGHLELEVEGDGSDDGHRRGQGHLDFESGELPAIPLLAEVEKLFQGTEIVGSTYEPFTVRYRLAGSLLVIEPFEVRSGELLLKVRGDVDLEGPLALRIAFSAPREGLEAPAVPKEVLEALTTADGRVELPILAAGTLLAPEVGFDRQGWQKSMQRRVGKELEKEAGKALGKLFGKKKKDG